MRIKLDENLPKSLVVELSRLGHEADTIYDVDLVVRLFAFEDTSTWGGCIIIATERKLRIQQSS
jgi:hypothetical protein